MARIANHMAHIDGYSEKAPHEAILDLPQERITGDILRGRGPRRGNLERLIRYWRPIMRKPGGFRRCLVILADHPELYPLERICAWLHHETTGLWPNEGNHHAGGKLGKIVKRTVKKPGRRKRRGKSDYIIPGVDFPIDRLERRLERKSGSILYAPLDGSIGQLEYKSGRVRRIERAVTSVLLPGERGALKPRHLLRTGLTPGGSGAPGPRLQISPGAGALRRGGATRGFRCPPGFERGGHFTDSRFSTCGHQLFGVPGSGRSALRTVSAAAAQRPTDEQRAAASAREKIGDRTLLRAKADGPTPGVGGGMPKLPAAVGSPNEAKQKDMVAKVLESMSGVTEKTDAPIRRLIREDGSILQPLAPLNIIGKQKNNPDLKNASLITRINEPGKFGLDELMLMQTGLRSIDFSLPGGGSVSLKRNGGLMAPGQARAFGKAIAQAKRQPMTDMDYAGLLRETALKSNAVTFTATVPGGGDANRIVRVTGPDGAKRVPYWVYKAFLSSSHKMAGEETEAPAEAGEKSLNDWPNEDWGPLQYTAALIPNYDAIDHTGGVGYKAAALSGYRKDITERFVEVKRIGSVWDRGINRFRCPPGMSNAGQITNRIGLGCGIPSKLPTGGRSRGMQRLINDIDRAVDNPKLDALEGRIVHAVEGSAGTRDFGPLNQPSVPDPDSHNRGRLGAVRDRLAMRIGRVLDVAADDLESAKLSRIRRRDQQRERVGPVERLNQVVERVIRVVDPEKLRSQREPQKLPTGLRADRAPEMRAHNNAAAFDRLVLLRSEWNTRMGKRPWNDITPDEPRKWMEEHGPNLPDHEFRQFEDAMLDFEILEEGFKGKAIEFNGPADELADMIDRLAIHGPVNLDAQGRRNRELREEAVEASRLRRQREANVINMPTGLSVPEEKRKLLEDGNYGGHVRRINERIKRHEQNVDRAKVRVAGGKANKAEIDRVIVDLATQRDKYRADAVRLELMNDPYDVETYLANLAIAEMYERELPALVNEARRFERLDNLKRNRKENGLGVYIFNDKAELANVAEAQMPSRNRNDLDNYVIAVGNAQDIGDIDQVLEDLKEDQRQADLEVAGFNEQLKAPGLTDDEVIGLAKLRGEAAWRGEAARRASIDARKRRAEIRGPAGMQFENPERTEGHLGKFDENGMPLIQRIEVGANGIKTQENAVDYLRTGGAMEDVPDDFLAQAIMKNPNRFKPVSHGARNANKPNKDDLGVQMYEDRETGRTIFIKGAYTGAHEGIAEITANQIAAQLGFSVGAMRIGAKPNHKGVIPVVFEHSQHHVDADSLILAGKAGSYPTVKRRLNDPGNIARGLLLDYIISNREDRHHENWFIGTNADGAEFMVPIDHGLAFNGWSPGVPKLVELQDWRDDRIVWHEIIGHKLKDGEFTPEEFADSIIEARESLDSDVVSGIMDSVAAALPPGYDNVRKGTDWSQVYPDLLQGRVANVNKLTRSELIEWAAELMNDPAEVIHQGY